MDITSDNRRRKRNSRFLSALFIINGLFVAGVLLWWQWMAGVMSEPVRWATWRALGPRPSMLEYPFILLWTLPLVAVSISWFARKFNNMRLACSVAFFPVFYLSLIVGWFYLAPQAWH
jgi:ABC-type multidrug transport system fused ATPase/permease subunit